MESTLTLRELNHKIRKILNKSFPESYWIITEMNDLKVNRSGHCYLELVEKDERDDKIVATARGIIWAYTFRMLKPYFESATGHEFKKGLKILIRVSVEFHELYGYSLHIHNIEPSYTLGDIAKKRMEIIKKLDNEGIIKMNQQLPLALVPQKIAVISSQTAAGYKDFVEHLNNNPYGYVFCHKLFPSYMQGDEAENSIIKALEHIYQYENLFDLVAIIRGGGAQTDLSCFDQYHLAANVAQFPLPVITGIGHEKDESVVDMVAHTRMKTPTAVADFIVARTYAYEENLLTLQNSIVEKTNQYIRLENQNLQNLTNWIHPNIKSILQKLNNNLVIYKEKLIHLNRKSIDNRVQRLSAYKNQLTSLHQQSSQKNRLELKHFETTLPNFLNRYIKSQNKYLENLNKANEYLNPGNILKRGYSITQKNGHTLKSHQSIEKGDIIHTYLYQGKMISEVRKKEDKNN